MTDTARRRGEVDSVRLGTSLPGALTITIITVCAFFVVHPVGACAVGGIHARGMPVSLPVYPKSAATKACN